MSHVTLTDRGKLTGANSVALKAGYQARFAGHGVLFPSAANGSIISIDDTTVTQ